MLLVYVIDNDGIVHVFEREISANIHKKGEHYAILRSLAWLALGRSPSQTATQGFLVAYTGRKEEYIRVDYDSLFL